MSTKVEIDFVSAILIGFFLFWLQSGWYRIDCSLQIQKACDAINSEYTKAKDGRP